jgi:glyoxylase-like metal-dependent hydrolase (beta-lactamase superfamily II)
MKSLAAAGVAPADITDIFISHAHGDHVGGLVTAGALVYPNAAIHMSAPEWAAMQADDKAKPIATAIAAKVAPFEPGAKLLPEVTAVATPGHTAGHSSYEIASNGEKLFYLGDVAHHFVISLAHPTWSIAFDGDKPAAQAMRQQTLAKLAADHELVYAVHFPFPGLGHIQAKGDGFAWDRQ